MPRADHFKESHFLCHAVCMVGVRGDHIVKQGASVFEATLGEKCSVYSRHTHASVWRQDSGQLSLYLWVLEIELRPSGLAASSLMCQTLSSPTFPLLESGFFKERCL